MEKGLFNRMRCPIEKKYVYIPVNGTACDGCRKDNLDGNIKESDGPGKITGCEFTLRLSPLDRMRKINEWWEKENASIIGNEEKRVDICL